jgi:hypothetical protein
MADKRNTRASGRQPSDSKDEKAQEPRPRDMAGVVEESPRTPDEATSNDAPVPGGGAREERTNASAAGLSADDPADGEKRKETYRRGAKVVSRID